MYFLKDCFQMGRNSAEREKVAFFYADDKKSRGRKSEAYIFGLGK